MTSEVIYLDLQMRNLARAKLQKRAAVIMDKRVREKLAKQVVHLTKIAAQFRKLY